MVYQTAANIRLMANMPTTPPSDATILAWQGVADGLINSFIASPNTGGALAVESELVRMIYENSKLSDIHYEFGGPSPPRPHVIELTDGMKAALVGPKTSGNVRLYQVEEDLYDES
jgi:hypothetical protein